MARLPDTLAQSKITIPVDIADFFLKVTAWIVAREECAVETSDDLLQDPSLGISGGLSNKQAKLYEFSYRPKQVPEVRWHLMLFDNELEDIGRRYITELVMWKCVNAECRNLFNQRGSVRCSCPLGRKQ